MNSYYLKLNDYDVHNGNMGSFESQLHLSFDDAKAKLDLVDRKLFDEIIIGGGEPLREKYLSDLISYAHNLGFKVALSTFGVGFSNDILASLKDSKLEKIILLVDSHKMDTVKKLFGTDRPEFQLEALRSFLDAGFNVEVRVIISFFNYKYLSEIFKFLVPRFPEVVNYSLYLIGLPNLLKENSWVMPRIYLTELELFRSLKFLYEHNKVVSVSGIPLCYMCDFEHASVEMTKIISEFYKINHSEDIKQDLLDINKRLFGDSHVKTKDPCDYCFMNPLCPGVKKDYVELYGFKEFYPLFKDFHKFLKQNEKKQD